MSTELIRANPDLQLVEMWLHGRSSRTQDYYRRTAMRFLSHCNKPLKQVTLSDLQSFNDVLVEMGITDSSLRSYLAAIKSLLTFGNKLGMLPVNVGVALKSPKVKDTLTERILSEADVLLMTRLETDPTNRMMLRLLYCAGLRVSELCDLKWSNAQERGEGAGQVTAFGKGGKTRSVIIPAAVWRELIEYKSDARKGAYMFPSSRTNKGVTRQHVWNVVKAAAERIGVKASPHWFRHSHATHSLDRGAPIHLVQQTLGHASVATTGKYLHCRPSESSSKYLAL
jgi:integrase/recombinase XerD